MAVRKDFVRFGRDLFVSFHTNSHEAREKLRETSEEVDGELNEI